MLKKIKTITSYSGLARWLAEHETDEPIAFLMREQVAHIPSPYAYSPVKGIYRWRGKDVIWFETRHKHYEVFEVPADMTRYEQVGNDYHIKRESK